MTTFYRYLGLFITTLITLTLMGAGCTTPLATPMNTPAPTAVDSNNEEISSPTPIESTSPTTVLATSTLAPTPLLPTMTPTASLAPTLPITSTFSTIPYPKTEWAEIIELQNIHRGLLSPDNSLIASAFIEETHVIDVATGDVKWIFEKDLTGITGTHVLLFSPDTSLLIVAGEEEIVYVWNVLTGELVYKFPFPISVFTADLTSDGRYLAVGNGGEGGGLIYVYDLSDGSWIEYPEQMFFGDIAFVPESTVLAISRQGFDLEDGAILFWDFVSGAQESVLSVEGGGDFPPGYISGGYLDISPSGNLIVVLVNDDWYLWDIHSEVETKLHDSTDDNTIKRVLFSVDGNLAMQGRDNSITVWNNHGRLLGSIRSEVNTYMWFSPDGKYLVLFLPDSSPLVWEIPDS